MSSPFLQVYVKAFFSLILGFVNKPEPVKAPFSGSIGVVESTGKLELLSGII